MGVRSRIPTADYMGYAVKGGSDHETKTYSDGTTRRVLQDMKGDILKMLRDLLGYVRSHDSCNLLLVTDYLIDLTDL